jgi:hypothetical protein
MVEHEYLVAQHGQAIEILRALVVRNALDRRLQPRDMAFERDRHLVPKAALHARAHRAQKPGGGRRHTEPDRRALDQPAAMGEHSFAQQHQP